MFAGGSLFSMISGARNAPKGFQRRTLAGIARVKDRAPILGTANFVLFNNIAVKKINIFPRKGKKTLLFLAFKDIVSFLKARSKLFYLFFASIVQ